MSAPGYYTKAQIDGATDEYARHYGRDTVLAEQAHETLRGMVGVERAAQICAGVRRRINREMAGLGR